MKVPVKKYDVIPGGDYKMQARDYDKEKGQFSEQIRWSMEFTQNSDLADRTLSYWTPTVFTIKNKGGVFAEACGLDVEPDVEIDLDDMLQVPVIATVVINHKKADGSEYNKIYSIRRIKKSKPDGAAPATKDNRDVFEDDGEDEF